MKLQLFLVAFLFASGFCSDDTLVGDLPRDVISELLSMLMNKTVNILLRCDDIVHSDIQLHLHTKNRPVLLDPTNPHEINPAKDIILLTHGWLSNKERYVPETTQAYLDVYDANIITLDWSTLSKSLYGTSVCYVPKIANLVADFLCLMKGRGTDFNKVHLVGHSLGAHISGLVGSSVQQKCGQKVARITALDPAGPLFRLLPADRRVDKTDAIFVDAIHTNQGLLGYWGDCGHADFYVNCGMIQLGCPNITLAWEGIVGLPVEIATCHHSRSVHYMTESISNPTHFLSRKCHVCPLPCIPSLMGEKTITMGEYCHPFAEGKYVLKTNFRPPFGGEVFIPGLNSIKKLISYT